MTTQCFCPHTHANTHHCSPIWSAPTATTNLLSEGYRRAWAATSVPTNLALTLSPSREWTSVQSVRMGSLSWNLTSRQVDPHQSGRSPAITQGKPKCKLSQPLRLLDWQRVYRVAKFDVLVVHLLYASILFFCRPSQMVVLCLLFAAIGSVRWLWLALKAVKRWPVPETCVHVEPTCCVSTWGR